jgi:hypothetical protein
MKHSILLRLAPVVSITFFGFLTAMADNAATAPGPKNQPIAVPNYSVAVSPDNIAPTPATQPQENVQVDGQPRNSVGHPCTLVDSDDIARYKDILKTNVDAQANLKANQKYCDDAMARPLAIPTAEKNPDGTWKYMGEQTRNTGTNAAIMQALGLVYQVTGDQKYGEFCKKMLLAYADNYNHWGHAPGWTPANYRSANDGRLSFQFLNDGGFLNAAAYAYDLVYTLPSWTPEERAHVRDDFLKAVAAQFWAPEIAKDDYLSQTNNRSCLCTAGVLIAGYACEDQEMINNALYGPGGTKDAPTGGLIKVHFGETCLLPDGLWVEGAPGYQLGIASCGLFNDANTLWHHGIDMYRYRNGALKRLLDSALVLAYPNPSMTVAALHDSGQFSLLDSPPWLSNEIGVPYENGYVRYKNPRYLPIIRHDQQQHAEALTMTFHNGGPSLFLDLPPAAQDPAPTIENVNFYSVGYGIIRQPAPMGANQLLLEYGVCAGHSHPSKLAIDLYALGGSFMPFPGMVFPYDNPLQTNWFTTTLSNCDLMIDEQSQNFGGRYFLYPRESPTPIADQLVYGPAATMGLQRAWSNTLYARTWPDPGAWAKLMGTKEWPVPKTPFSQVNEDRSLFLAPEYMVDIFGAFSMGPHQYDLAWHILGDMTSTLTTEPFTFPDPVPYGYNAMENVTHANTDQPWTATVTMANKQAVRFLAAGGTPTDVYIGNRVADTRNPKSDKPPMFFQRRDNQNNVIFGNAVDISGTPDGYLKSVTQEGSLDTGYGLLKLETVKGTDLCFTAFRPGSYTVDGMTTDAMQAMVRMDGTNAQGMYLGGGTSLKTSAGTIQRSAPGLAYVEKSGDDGYIIGNPSPSDATVTVTLPALSGLKAYALDADGKETGPAPIKAGGGTVAADLKANSKIELSAK